jgi:hypothetical protein
MAREAAMALSGTQSRKTQTDLDGLASDIEVHGEKTSLTDARLRHLKGRFIPPRGAQYRAQAHRGASLQDGHAQDTHSDTDPSSWCQSPRPNRGHRELQAIRRRLRHVPDHRPRVQADERTRRSPTVRPIRRSHSHRQQQRRAGPADGELHTRRPREALQPPRTGIGATRPHTRRDSQRLRPHRARTTRLPRRNVLRLQLPARQHQAHHDGCPPLLSQGADARGEGDTSTRPISGAESRNSTSTLSPRLFSAMGSEKVLWT